MSPLIRPPDAARWIVRRLEDAGFETWAVGGAVRDALAGHPTDEWDFATAARPNQVRKVFRRTVPVGIEHGTVGVLAADGRMYEVTTFRRDVDTDGRHARVEFSDDVTEDLARRDFTINALAWHPFRDELLDPHGGRADLAEGRLRTVGDPSTRFSEDYLRVLRAIRFAARFDLDIDGDTWAAICDAAPHLDRLSSERVREELLKTLGSCEKPSAALTLLYLSGAVATLVPELARSDGPGLPVVPVLATDLVPSSRPLLRLGLWMSALDDPGEGDRATADAHPAAGGSHAPPDVRAAVILERLRFSRAEIAAVAALVRGLALPLPDPEDEVDVRRWCSAVGREELPGVLRAVLARERVLRWREGRELDSVVRLARACRAVARSGVPLSVRELSVDGRALIRAGLKPGPRFGEILDRLLHVVLLDPDRDEPEELIRLARSMGWEEDSEGRDEEGEEDDG